MAKKDKEIKVANKTKENATEETKEQKANKSKKSKEKHRAFAFILYPDSLPEDWLVKLEGLDIPMAISPLHDRDKVAKSKLTDAEKERAAKGKAIYKKAHYHAMYMAKNPVTADAVRRKIKRTLGNNTISHVEIVDSPRNMFLYLTHDSQDAINKGKTKYDSEDIIELNGFDIDRYIVLDQADKDDIYVALADFIEDYKIENYAELVMNPAFDYDELGIPSRREFLKVWRQYGASLGSMMTGFYQMRMQEEAEAAAQENKRNR